MTVTQTTQAPNMTGENQTAHAAPNFDKKTAKASLHRDSFLAPLARGNGTLPGAVVGLRLLNPTAGPLGTIEG